MELESDIAPAVRLRIPVLATRRRDVDARVAINVACRGSVLRQNPFLAKTDVMLDRLVLLPPIDNRSSYTSEGTRPQTLIAFGVPLGSRCI